MAQLKRHSFACLKATRSEPALTQFIFALMMKENYQTSFNMSVNSKINNKSNKKFEIQFRF